MVINLIAILIANVYLFLIENNFVFRSDYNHIADIYDEVSVSIRALGLDTECLGGGRIEHFPGSKILKVFGYSTVS